MTPDALAEPHACSANAVEPWRASQLARCHCGAWWQTVVANDVLTEGPMLVWRRVGRWDLRARWRIARISRLMR